MKMEHKNCKCKTVQSSQIKCSQQYVYYTHRIQWLIKLCHLTAVMSSEPKSKVLKVNNYYTETVKNNL